jgi:hypothetical protein
MAQYGDSTAYYRRIGDRHLVYPGKLRSMYIQHRPGKRRDADFVFFVDSMSASACSQSQYLPASKSCSTTCMCTSCGGGLGGGGGGRGGGGDGGGGGGGGL